MSTNNHYDINLPGTDRFNRLTLREAYLRQRCVYRYQRILPDTFETLYQLQVIHFHGFI